MALLPATAVAGELATGELRRVQLSGAPPIRRRVVLVERRAAGPPPVPLAALRELLAVIPEIVPGAGAIRASGSRSRWG